MISPQLAAVFADEEALRETLNNRALRTVSEGSERVKPNLHFFD